MQTLPDFKNSATSGIFCNQFFLFMLSQDTIYTTENIIIDTFLQSFFNEF